MATVKNTSGNYTITVADGLGLLTINADLDVIGNITYIDSTELKVTDPFITVAANNNGAIQSMGLVAQKTTTSFAGLRFNTVSGDWEISDSVNAEGDQISPYQAILAGVLPSTTPGLPNNSVQFNVSNVFTGNSAFTFDVANSKVNITGQLVLGNIATTPTATANSAALYNGTVGAGGTGVYVRSTTVNDELVSKQKAIVYSLVL
jgi:hypothetical protein